MLKVCDTMNEDAQSHWSAPAAGTDEDFSNFLDFHDVDISFPEGGTRSRSSTAQQDIMELGADDYATGLDESQLSTPVSTAYPSADCLADIAVQQRLYQQQINQQGSRNGQEPYGLRDQQTQRSEFFRHGMVPPTPNSVEMHGAQVHAFTDPQALGMYESGKPNDHMVFTPLVSPAFQLPDLYGSGEYFSPLSSPALQAQDYGRGPPSIIPSKENDRIDGPNSASSRKSKRRSGVSSKDPVHAIRSSPAMKARQKRYSGGGKPPREVADIVSGLRTIQGLSPALHATGNTSTFTSKTGSETGSISPEPLSEVLMPPPAAPRSSNHGQPSMSSPHEHGLGPSEKDVPATPASLFKTPKSDFLLSNKDGQPAAQSLDSQSRVLSSTSASYVQTRDADTSASRMPARSGHDTADASGGNSGSGSYPSEKPTGSLQNQTPTSTGIKEGMQNRGVKKRTGSTHVSPALRPRISPSIKPLLPGGSGLDSEATAALLANKSNYERIIDGSASQLGVKFPAQLSENLTSKRTSHKLAEQGRRNRINTALAEIQALLPEDFGADLQDLSAPSSTTVTGNQGGASKAKTVENAIEFIKTLKMELSQVKFELDTTKKLMAATEAENRELKAKAARK